MKRHPIPTGINLEQLFISPSVAYKRNERHAIGLALNLAHQRFEAKGLQPLTQASASPGNVTHRGTDSTNEMPAGSRA